MTYWQYGTHAAEAALKNPVRKVKRVLALATQAERFGPLAEARKVKLEVLQAQALEKILQKDATHQGVAAYVEPLQQPHLLDIAFTGKAPVLVLDQVTDPHNVGAILRTAAAFNVACIIQQERHSPPETGALAKAACGALEHVPLVNVTNIANALLELKEKNYWVAGFAGEATTTLKAAKLSSNTALVLGSEGEGLRRLVAERCDVLVKIPISPLMESLNVSNACAIGLYQLTVGS